MDPIIFIGVPPFMLAFTVLLFAFALAIAVGLLNYHDRCDAEDAAAAEAEAAAGPSDGADA